MPPIRKSNDPELADGLEALTARYQGAVGRVRRPGKPDWGRDYRVRMVKLDEDAQKILLELETVERIDPGFDLVKLRPNPPRDVAAHVVPNCPLTWFRITTPAPSPETPDAAA